jgi:hypothetical protein
VGKGAEHARHARAPVQRKGIAIGRLGWEEKKDRLEWVDILDRFSFVPLQKRKR